MGGKQKARGGRYTPKKHNPDPRRQKIFSYLCTKGAALIQQAYGVASCVPASLIAQDVLNHFGMDASCYPVKLRVLRSGAAFFVHGTGELIRSNGVVSGWDGHLIVVSRVHRAYEVLDLTLEQANRPDQGIILRPIWADLSPEFWTTGESHHDVDGSIVSYERIDNDGWKHMPLTSQHHQLAQAIIEGIEQFLGLPPGS